MKIKKLILENQILIMKGLMNIGDKKTLEEMKKQINKIETELKIMIII